MILTFSGKPLRIGSGSNFSGINTKDGLRLIFTMSDSTIKIKDITKNEKGFSSAISSVVAIGDAGVILGENIIVADGVENMQRIKLEN